MKTSFRNQLTNWLLLNQWLFYVTLFKAEQITEILLVSTMSLLQLIDVEQPSFISAFSRYSCQSKLDNISSRSAIFLRCLYFESYISLFNTRLRFQIQIIMTDIIFRYVQNTLACFELLTVILYTMLTLIKYKYI